MTAADALDRGRESFGRRAWGDAYAQLSAADRESPLEPEDLERLATAAYLVGRDDDSADVWTRAHHACLRRGSVERAARCAFWLAFGLLLKGELARGGGWLARARRLLDDGQQDCVEQGYLLCPVALQRHRRGRRREPRTPPSARPPRSASASATRTWWRSPGSARARR